MEVAGRVAVSASILYGKAEERGVVVKEGIVHKPRTRLQASFRACEVRIVWSIVDVVYRLHARAGSGPHRIVFGQRGHCYAAADGSGVRRKGGIRDGRNSQDARKTDRRPCRWAQAGEILYDVYALACHDFGFVCFICSTS